MGKKRSRYSREFKVEAVRLASSSDATIGRVATELGIHPNTLRAWIKELEKDPEHAFPGHGKLKPEAAEMQRLKRENARLKQELEFLKKTARYFAKESR